MDAHAEDLAYTIFLSLKSAFTVARHDLVSMIGSRQGPAHP